MNLIPDVPSGTPNYWCTWSTQNYSLTPDEIGIDDPAIFEGVSGFRLTMDHLDEKRVFHSPGWITNYYDKIRSDLYVVFDVGWDIPYGVLYNEELWKFGSVELEPTRFPSFTGTPTERLYKLDQHVKAAGWRGAGLWIAPQVLGDGRNGHFTDTDTARRYWSERAHWCAEAGIEYWKADIGARCGSVEFRRLMTEIAREEAPLLAIEHAPMGGPLNDVPASWENYSSASTYRYSDYGDLLARSVALLEFSDVLRLYDVTNQLSVATTLDRVASVLHSAPAGTTGLVNCEDEVYLAAALGCAMGIMRHPIWKPRSGIDYDTNQYAKRIDEVIRAVRWQRIAPAFGAGEGAIYVDDVLLTDSWHFEAGQTWAEWVVGQEILQRAPARVSRGMPLPEVAYSAHGSEVPFVVASHHPNGAIAVATLPRVRTVYGSYLTLVDVVLEVPGISAVLGIFGLYKSLSLRFCTPITGFRVYAQDLASNSAVDISERVSIDGNIVTLPGDLLRQIGSSASTPNDCSYPGLVVRFEPIMPDNARMES
jgi:hypothetical protein